MIILLVLLGVSVALAIAAAVDCSYERGGFTVTCIIWTAFVIIIWACVYYSNLGTIRKMEMFYNIGRKNYIQTIKETQKSIVRLKGSAIPVESFEHSKQITERIREYRDRVEMFNQDLVGLRVHSDNPFTSWYVPVVPEDLQVIEIGDVLG